MTSRGIRNNNPGNIRVGDDWLGLAKREEMTAEQQKETAFAVFSSPVYGIRAMAKILLKYQRKHGLKTLAKMIKKWAPAGDGSNDPAGYAAQVAGAAGIGVDTEFDFGADSQRALKIIKAMIYQENGSQPFSNITIMNGLEMAGLNVGEAPTSAGSVQMDNIKQIQTLLNRLGTKPQLNVDGVWGPRSDDAFRRIINGDQTS